MTFAHQEGALPRTSTRGPVLYYGYTAPEGAPKAAVALLHGYGDYGGRYEHVVQLWASKGIATVTIDMRGHGKAEGRRGHCDHFSEYLDDFAELTKVVAERAGGVPAFLFGHSFGGLVSSSAVQDRPSVAAFAGQSWRGLVLSSPFFGMAKDPPSGQLAVGKVIGRFVPTFAVPVGIKGADVTHDAARARAYDEDPLVFKNTTLRWVLEARAAQARALERAGEVKLPLYLFIGTADHVVSIAAARKFFDSTASADKTWEASQGHFHEVLNEPEWQPVAERVASWVLARAI
jgi:alpha-beta hydrolase superfamily lysophospholipase